VWPSAGGLLLFLLIAPSAQAQLRAAGAGRAAADNAAIVDANPAGMTRLPEQQFLLMRRSISW